MRTNHIGFTGSRVGYSDRQFFDLEIFLKEYFEEYYNRNNYDIYPDVPTFHHGDCIGSDIIAVEIAQNIGYWTVAHPPDKDIYRAFHKSNEILEPKPYLQRNQDIVEESFMLIATPSGPEQTRSGTWSTIRYARLRRKPILILEPK